MSTDDQLNNAKNILSEKYPDKEFTVTKNVHGDDVVAFTHDGMSIFDPYASDCGRFAADPMDSYELAHEDAELMAEVNALAAHAPAKNISK